MEVQKLENLQKRCPLTRGVTIKNTSTILTI